MASSRGPLSPIGNTPPFMGASVGDGSPSPAKPGRVFRAVDQPFTSPLPLKLPPPARLASEAKPAARWLATAGQTAVLQAESGFFKLLTSY